MAAMNYGPVREHRRIHPGGRIVRVRPHFRPRPVPHPRR